MAQKKSMTQYYLIRKNLVQFQTTKAICIYYKGCFFFLLFPYSECHLQIECLIYESTFIILPI